MVTFSASSLVVSKVLVNWNHIWHTSGAVSFRGKVRRRLRKCQQKIRHVKWACRPQLWASGFSEISIL